MLKNIICIILFLSTILYSNSFEQNGVKEGNSRVSVGLYGERHYLQSSENLDIKFNATYGKFLSDSFEISLKLKDNTDFKDHIYKIDSGYNFYLFKELTYTPYIGFELGISGNTRVNSKTINEEGIYLGIHNFFSENIALTNEIGFELTDLKKATETYYNIYITYFFD